MAAPAPSLHCGGVTPTGAKWTGGNSSGAALCSMASPFTLRPTGEKELMRKQLLASQKLSDMTDSDKENRPSGSGPRSSKDIWWNSEWMESSISEAPAELELLVS